MAHALRELREALIALASQIGALDVRLKRPEAERLSA